MGGINRKTKSFLSSFLYLSANQEKGDGPSMDKDDRKIKYLHFPVIDVKHNFLYTIFNIRGCLSLLRYCILIFYTLKRMLTKVGEI
jgi:hypothetical protein